MAVDEYRSFTPLPIFPANTITGAVGATSLVALATPYGVLPNLVWKSIPPSPVKT